MRMVYQATTLPEAHVVADMLRQHGIEAGIWGENLGLYADPIGNVRLGVATEQEVEARRLIAEWESETSSTTPVPPPKPDSGLAGIAVGALIAGVLIIATVWLFTSPWSPWSP